MSIFRSYLDEFTSIFKLRYVILAYVFVLNVRFTYDICFGNFLNRVFQYNGIPLKVRFMSIIYLILLYLIFFIVQTQIERFWLFLDGARNDFTKKEKIKLDKIIEDCFTKIKEAGYIHKIKIYIVDNMEINAYSMPKSIVLTRGLVETMRDDEIKAIILHEFAHIKRFNCRIDMLLYFCLNLPFSFLLIISRLLEALADILNMGNVVFKFIGELINIIAILFNIIPKLVFSILQVFVYGGKRHSEYEADKLVVDFGYKDSLIKALYTVYDMQVSEKKGLINQLLKDHPNPALRIVRLENM